MENINMQQGNKSDLVTVSEVARMLQVSGQTVRNWHNQGILEASRLSNRARIFDRESINDFNLNRHE
jgi:DNA-binding transcriptional MerR regulator